MLPKSLKIQIFSFFCLYLLQQNVLSTETIIHKNEQNGLLTWKVKDDGFTIELIQLVPDYIRAVYSKYDFPDVEIEKVAAFCTFGAIIENTSNKQLIYNVANWRYVDQEDQSHPIKTKNQWLKEWRKAGIIFSWTMLADSENFNVGDWQQGFITLKIERNQRFNFIYTWVIEGKSYQGIIENMSCAYGSSPESSKKE